MLHAQRFLVHHIFEINLHNFKGFGLIPIYKWTRAFFVGFVRLYFRPCFVASENIANGMLGYRQPCHLFQFIFQPERSIAGLFSKLQYPGFDLSSRFVLFPAWRFRPIFLISSDILADRFVDCRPADSLRADLPQFLVNEVGFILDQFS